MSTENPVPPPVTGEVVHPTATTAPAGLSPAFALGRDQGLVIGGAAAVVLSDLIGALTQDWSLDLSHWLMIIGSLVAAAIVFSRSAATVAGLPMSTVLRIAAAIVVAYGLVDFGDLLSSLGDWSAIDLVLTAIEAAGAAALAWAAWSLSRGSLAADVTGAAQTMRLGLNDGLVHAGAIGVIVGWFLLMAIADVYNFTVDAQFVVLAATFVLVVRWLNRNPDAGRLPIATPWGVAGLAAVAVLLGLWWFTRIIGDTLEFGDLSTYVPLLIYILALVSLGVGAFLGLGSAMPAPKADPPVAPPAA